MNELSKSTVDILAENHSSWLHLANLDTIGGVETSLAKVMTDTSFKNQGHTLIVGSGRLHPRLREDLNDVKRIQAKHLGPFRLPKWPALRRLILHARLPTKVNHFVSWNQLHLPMALSSLEKVGVVVYYERGAGWLTPVDKDSLSFLKRCDHLLCNSKAASRLLDLRYGISTSRSTVPPGLRPIFQHSPEGVERRKGHLGMVGRFVPLKGHAVALHAMAEAKKLGRTLHLHIVGGGVLESTLRELTRSLGLKEQVTFYGLIHDMPRFYSGLDAVICPSIREPFGQVCMEARAQGCRLIATSIDGIPESSGPGARLLRPNLDLSEFYDDLSCFPEKVYDPESDTLVAPKVIDPCLLARAILEELELPFDRDSSKVWARSTFPFEGHVETLVQALTSA